MARNCVRNIGRLELRHLGGGELEVERRDGIVQMLGLGGADDRCGDAGLADQPGESDLRAGNASCGRDGGDRLDHLAIGLRRGGKILSP